MPTTRATAHVEVSWPASIMHRGALRTLLLLRARNETSGWCAMHCVTSSGVAMCALSLSVSPFVFPLLLIQ